jgi:hypothetical protein
MAAVSTVTPSPFAPNAVTSTRGRGPTTDSFPRSRTRDRMSRRSEYNVVFTRALCARRRREARQRRGRERCGYNDFPHRADSIFKTGHYFHSAPQQLKFGACRRFDSNSLATYRGAQSEPHRERDKGKRFHKRLKQFRPTPDKRMVEGGRMPPLQPLLRPFRLEECAISWFWSCHSTS